MLKCCHFLSQIAECSLQGSHGQVEPGKAQYSTPFFLTGCFLLEGIETQNLGKAQALGALPAMEALSYSAINKLFNIFSRKIRKTVGPIQHEI